MSLFQSTAALESYHLVIIFFNKAALKTFTCNVSVRFCRLGFAVGTNRIVTLLK